jgi:hypothetical protein
VVVSAKFGGDFKIVHTTKKSKVASVESFAQDCTTEALSMFSGSWKTSFNALVVNMDINKSNKNTDTQKDDANMARKKQRT